jgi:hypothetical protein
VGVRWGILLVLSACGAQVGTTVDPPDVDAPVTIDPPDAPVVAVDAAPDARACTGGNGAAPVGDGSCVVFFSTPKNFGDAQAACIMFGSQLAILDSADRDAAAKSLIGTSDVWLGLSDLAQEGTFKWIDGTALAFQNFAANEPNNANGAFEEDCTMYSGSRGGWDDRPCDANVANVGTTPTEYAFLCMF